MNKPNKVEIDEAFHVIVDKSNFILMERKKTRVKPKKAERPADYDPHRHDKIKVSEVIRGYDGSIIQLSKAYMNYAAFRRMGTSSHIHEILSTLVHAEINITNRLEKIYKAKEEIKDDK